ncbi:hypothetical protein GCM10007160_13230 [Litchfieldella qijiaojingensis]|uniref:DUF2125 domain-containing protein n=1 Tax=Litchfieldella qijiaojingensis TaxID=980347 RepID=A0ABQ2YMK1_9GAMM|nr:DUF945 family protein [Halomonas qijiaojingensis]GGX87243.1 hypothetical protein GCM10007160_13230 [Halomonas qijiaojingensis]
MRKGLFVVVVIAVLGAGYLVAQATSSLLFERELERTLNDLAARGDLHVERHDVERGWFVSHGEIVLTPRLGEGESWRFELPYTARHGVLSTRAEGRLVPVMGEDDSLLFGEWLPVTPPRWHAEYRTLSNDLELRVDLVGFQTTEGERLFDFQGGELLLSGRRDDVRLQARLGPLDVEQGDDIVQIEPLILDIRHRLGDDDHPPHLALDTLRLASPSLGLEVDIVGELRFLGGDWRQFRLSDLENDVRRQHWRSRLDGHFTWDGPPALVLLQLGLPLSTDVLEVEIEAGEVTINDRPLPSLH